MRHLSFGRLSAVEFEEFCFDLLHALRFINIDWRKGIPLKTSPADSGRDIVAFEERNRRRWEQASRKMVCGL
jgi:hypothetical protein